MICKDCKKEFKHLNSHHDPPKSAYIVENGTKFFIDKDGQKKIVLIYNRDRRLCRKCHAKADKEWGLQEHKFYKKKKRTWWKKLSLNKL